MAMDGGGFAQEDAWQEDLAREPYNVRLWCSYLEARESAPSKQRFAIYARALENLPGSYKASLMQHILCIFLSQNALRFVPWIV